MADELTVKQESDVNEEETRPGRTYVPNVEIRETDSLAGEFLPYSELLSLAEQDDSPFESWSTLLLRSGVLAPRVDSAALSPA